MVCEHGLALVADGGDAIARAGKLAQTHGEQIAELGVGTVVNVVIAPHCKQLAVLVRAELDVHEGGGALAGVGDVLELIEYERDGAAGDFYRSADERLVCRGELVAEGAARVVLHKAKLLHRNADAARYHRHMKMYADGLGVNGNHAVLVYVAVAAVGLKVQVRLTRAVALYLDLLCVGDAVPIKVGSLDAVRLVEDVGYAGVNFNSVRLLRVHGVHVGGKLLDLHLDGVRSGAGVRLGVRRDDGYCIAELEYLVRAEHGTLKAVGLVVLGEHDKTVYLVGAACGKNILIGDDLKDAGHLLGLGGIDALDVGVRYRGLREGEAKRILGHLERFVGAEVPSAGDLLRGGGTDVFRALDAVSGGLEYKILLAHLTAHDGGSRHCSVDKGLIAGAAAEVAVFVEPVAYLLAGRVRVLVEQHLGADDEAGGAEAALRAAVCHPCDLKRVHIVQSADALYRRYLRVVSDFLHLKQAGASDLAV